jgi:hypothetical protein
MQASAPLPGRTSCSLVVLVCGLRGGTSAGRGSVAGGMGCDVPCIVAQTQRPYRLARIGWVSCLVLLPARRWCRSINRASGRVRTGAPVTTCRPIARRWPAQSHLSLPPDASWARHGSSSASRAGVGNSCARSRTGRTFRLAVPLRLRAFARGFLLRSGSFRTFSIDDLTLVAIREKP